MAHRKKNAAPRRFTNADKALFRKFYESTVFMGGPRRDSMIPKYGGRNDINYVLGVRVRPKNLDDVKRMVDRGVMYFTQVSERDGYPPMPMTFVPTKKTVSGRSGMKVYAMISDVYLDHPHWLLPGYVPMPMQGRQMPAPARGGTDDGTGLIKSGYTVRPGVSPKAKALIQAALKTKRRAGGTGHGVERKGRRQKTYVGAYDPVTGKILNPSQMSHAERADRRMQQAMEHLESAVVLFEQGKWMEAYSYAMNAQGEAWRAMSDIEDGGDILQRVQGTAEMGRLIGTAKTLQEQVIRLHESGADLPERKPNPRRAGETIAGDVGADLLVAALNPKKKRRKKPKKNPRAVINKYLKGL